MRNIESDIQPIVRWGLAHCIAGITVVILSATSGTCRHLLVQHGQS